MSELSSEGFKLKKAVFFISPKKLNLIAGLIRKKKLDYVLETLSFVNKKGSRLLLKLFKDTLVKKVEKEKELLGDFFLDRLEINRGLILKRVITRAKGVSNRIRRRFSVVNFSVCKKITLKK